MMEVGVDGWVVCKREREGERPRSLWERWGGATAVGTRVERFVGKGWRG